jgi:TPP-dependent 2-oxoacid decarboxylase
MGTYWAGLSSPNVCSIVENSDLQIFGGNVFTDYTTVGWTTLLNDSTTGIFMCIYVFIYMLINR